MALTVLYVPYSLDMTFLAVPYSLDSGRASAPPRSGPSPGSRVSRVQTGVGSDLGGVKELVQRTIKHKLSTLLGESSA